MGIPIMGCMGRRMAGGAMGGGAKRAANAEGRMKGHMTLGVFWDFLRTTDDLFVEDKHVMNVVALPAM